MSTPKKMFIPVCIAAFLVMVTLSGCKEGQKAAGEKGQASAQSGSKTDSGAKKNVSDKGNFHTFVRYIYTDPMTGMEAFRLLIPKGWRTEGRISWSPNPALPAQARFRFFNPHGTEEFNLFPTQAYFWTNNQLALSTNPPGSAFTPPYFINYWYIDYVFSFKAGRNMLDSQAKVFQTMGYSLKVNPRWFAKVANVREMLAQNAIRGIKAIGRIGDMVARAGSNLREDQMRDWERRQQANDRIVQNFTDNIRGVERFNDPFAGKEVELPSGYGRAFANNLGEYIVTDSPSFNPNVGSNLRWEEMTLAK